MPVPSTINDLSTTAGSNSPAGSESPALIDDYLRAHGSFIASLRDDKVSKTGDETVAGTKTFSGNLGIGVTPSAWGSGRKAIDIGSSGSVSSISGSGYLVGYSNSYYNGAAEIYKTSNFATYYTQNALNGTHSWGIAPSGTAGNAISFTQAMTLNASGNLGIGTNSPSFSIHAVATPSAGNATAVGVTNLQVGPGATTLNLTSTGFSANGVGGGESLLLASDSGPMSIATWANNPIKFIVNSAERARIDSSGNLLVGTTSAGSTATNSVTLERGGSYAYMLVNHSATASGEKYAYFNYNGSTIGSITQSGTTAVAYNTSSDYRLKHSIVPMQNALQRVAALKPVTYKWNVDGSDGEGFIAHELAEVCPSAVTGEKDAVDADGKPVYQGIDTSFLVATLTAAIQEQQAIITELRSRIEALEAK